MAWGGRGGYLGFILRFKKKFLFGVRGSQRPVLVTPAPQPRPGNSKAMQKQANMNPTQKAVINSAFEIFMLLLHS